MSEQQNQKANRKKTHSRIIFGVLEAESPHERSDEAF